MAALTVLSCYTAISGRGEGRDVPGIIRALGVGLPYGIGVAVFGGSAEYVALAFKSAGHESGLFLVCRGHVRGRAGRRHPPARHQGQFADRDALNFAMRQPLRL